MPPVEVKAVELARPRQGQIWNLDVRELANTMRTGLRSAPYGERGWLIATEIHAPQPCTLKVHLFPNYEPIEFRINDYVHERTDVVDGEYGPFEVPLHAGANYCVLRNPEWPSLLFECDQPLTFSAERVLDGAAWVFVGPMNEFSPEFAAAFAVTSLDDLPANARRVAIPPSANKTDIFALTASQHFYAVDGGFCTYEITRVTPRPALGGQTAADRRAGCPAGRHRRLDHHLSPARRRRPPGARLRQGDDRLLRVRPRRPGRHDPRRQRLRRHRRRRHLLDHEHAQQLPLRVPGGAPGLPLARAARLPLSFADAAQLRSARCASATSATTWPPTPWRRSAISPARTKR